VVSPKPQIVRDEETIPATEQFKGMADMTSLRDRTMIVWMIWKLFDETTVE